MGYDSNNFIYLSEMINLPVIDCQTKRKIGNLVDLAATMIQVYPRITGLLIRLKGKTEQVYIPWSDVKKSQYRKFISVDFHPENVQKTPGVNGSEFIIRKTFLDKQIISTSGYKVVRVNDLQLLIDDSTRESSNLWLVHIDIGMKGLWRRMGWLKLMNGMYKWIVSHDMKDKFVPWKYVQPTSTTDIRGTLHLKIDSSKLIEVHPADLADIIEDLGTEERISLLESLDNLTAAATLQEIPIRIRVQISDTLESNKLASIINEMRMDEAVDLLDEISIDKRNEVFQFLDENTVSEIKELSKLSAYTVGSIMNTEFITVKATNTVQEVLDIIRIECEKSELIYYIYVLNDESKLIGTVTLRHLLSSKPETPVNEIMSENIISVKLETKKKDVAKIFFKYNFDAVPVIDEDENIQGIITLRDVLEEVFPEISED